MTPTGFNEVRLGSGHSPQASGKAGETAYASSENKSMHYALTVVGGDRLSAELIDGVYMCSADTDLDTTNEASQLAVFLAEADRDYGDMLKRLAD